MLASYIIVISSISLLLIVIYLYHKNHKVKYLVFSSVGDRNNIYSWLSGSHKKNFDLVAYYYGDNAEATFDADLVVIRKGLKFENFYHFLKHNNISQYDAVWVADDDLVIDTGSINRMFEIFSTYNLLLAQPSFAKGSKIPWSITKNNPECILRYTNFVENNAVIFSADVIPLLAGTFADAGTGFGVDFIWTSLLGFPEGEIAVIDAVSCKHPITDYSALDGVIPRRLHKVQGTELLIKYGLLPSGWSPTKANPNPIPFKPDEYSRILKE